MNLTIPTIRHHHWPESLTIAIIYLCYIFIGETNNKMLYNNNKFKIPLLSLKIRKHHSYRMIFLFLHFQFKPFQMQSAISTTLALKFSHQIPMGAQQCHHNGFNKFSIQFSASFSLTLNFFNTFFTKFQRIFLNMFNNLIKLNVLQSFSQIFKTFSKNFQ